MPDAEVCVLVKSHDLVVTDIGLRELPGTRMADAPMLGLLFIGGGLDVKALMEDEETISFYFSPCAGCCHAQGNVSR